MGTKTAALCSLVFLQVVYLSSGEPTSYRTYRILSSGVTYPNYNDYYNYNRNPYVEHPSRYRELLLYRVD